MKVFIGYDSREDEAYQVARASILEHSPGIDVSPIVRSDLIDRGIFRRSHDLRASTEFTLTRFLVPFLSDYKGFSLFVDCDILCNVDVLKILDNVDESCDVSCVQHDYTPKGKFKMDGKEQHIYPKKNWSSVMVYNNSKCWKLTPDVINLVDPSYLHQMRWADKIGYLDHTWNYLAGYYSDIDNPNIIHYTDGGPWFPQYENCEFAEEWKQAAKNLKEKQ
jgi:lipopolysaccharide biosynthesis glycosyltransferase